MSWISVAANAGRIAALRTERALDAFALAGKSGCTVELVTRMEQGAAVDVASLDAVANALGVELFELVSQSHPDELSTVDGASRHTGGGGYGFVRWLIRLHTPATTESEQRDLLQRLTDSVGSVERVACDSVQTGIAAVVSLRAGRRIMKELASGGFPELRQDLTRWVAPIWDDATEDSGTLDFCTLAPGEQLSPAWTDSNDAELAGMFEPGMLVGERYVIHHTLGRGAMGRVFLATDTRLERPVALKVVAHASPQMEEALGKEARMGANLNHRAIATVMDYGFVGDKSYTIFEYVVGERLREVLVRRGKLPLTEAIQLLSELAAALDFAHSRGIIHRDLKPENVVCQEDGQVKILDLGIARDVTAEVQSRAYSGTPAYSSPEQARCMPTTGKSDQYALALIAFELLTGRRPFESGHVVELLQKQVETPPPAIREWDATMPTGVESALVRGLAKDPGERFVTCQEFAAALEAAIGSHVETAAGYLVGVPEAERITFYVSHVADDSLVAKRIADALEEAGCRCWYCGRDALPGVPFRRQSQAAIRRSAANVLLISRPALNSPDFAAEIQQAHEIGCPLLPLLIDVSQNEFEKFNPAWRLLLGGLAATEFQRRDPVDGLVERLLSSASALGIGRSTGPHQGRLRWRANLSTRNDPQDVDVAGQVWATDAFQIAIQDLSRVVYRNDLVDEFLRHRQKHFISGTKGIGKTLVLTYKRTLLAKDTAQRGPVTMIPEGRPYLDLMSEMKSLSSKYERPLSSLSTTKRLWAMSFRVSAVSHYPGVIDPTEAFELKPFPERVRRWLQGAQVQPTVVFKELTSMQLSRLNQLIDATENFLDQKVREIHTPIYFFVDRVDQALRDLSRDAWIYVQAGLIEAGWDMMNTNAHIKVYATIRQEAFTNYESDVKANLFGATTSLQYSDDELAAILDKLSACYEGQQRFADFVGFHVIRHPARPEPEDCVQFIRRHTFGRPRDLVVIAGELASRRSSLNEKMVSDTVRELASSTLVANIFGEVRILHDCLHDRNARHQFLGMLPTNILERETAIEICERFNGLAPGTLQHFGEDSEDVHHPFRDLYLSGLLGVIENSTELGERIQRFRQPRDLLTGAGKELPESEYYLIHPALNAFIRQHRTRDPYHQVQHITTGERQLWRAYYPVIVGLEGLLFQHANQRFVASIHQLVKRICSFLQTGSTEFARAEVQANAYWDYVQSQTDEQSREALMWLDELAGYL